MARTVLVVDDSRTARNAVCQVLIPAGFEVLEAIDGQDALRQFEEHSNVSLVFLDVNLPDKNGLQILHEIRQRDHLSPAFVILTTEARPQLMQEARVAGAKAWLVKPFAPELLLAAAKKFST